MSLLFLMFLRLCFLICILWQDLLWLCTEYKIKTFEKEKHMPHLLFHHNSLVQETANKTELWGKLQSDVGASLPSAGQWQYHEWFQRGKGLRRGTPGKLRHRERKGLGWGHQATHGQRRVSDLRLLILAPFTGRKMRAGNAPIMVSLCWPLTSFSRQSY